jgi:hypothetical protein
MESASIWDIYSSAKKLLPLYDRMQNRAVRQESRTVQRHLSNGSVENIEAQTQPQNNNDDILSLDLLTPLTASPAGAGAGAVGVGAGATARKNFPNSNKSQSQTILQLLLRRVPTGRSSVKMIMLPTIRNHHPHHQRLEVDSNQSLFR